MSKRIEQQVDQLLLEQGEYRPLELLLWEGRLDAEDYQAWVRGEIPYLAERLFGDPHQTEQSLHQAAEYLTRRGWEAESIHYTLKGRPKGAPLRFSAERQFDECFHRIYRKPSSELQFDLFSDTSSTVLINRFTQALIKQDVQAAGDAIGQLFETAPDLSHLGELERLFEALQGLHNPVADIPQSLERLQNETAPLAERHLGVAGKGFVQALWRQLSEALREQPFSTDQAMLHPSFTAALHEDWDWVRQAVERESEWFANGILLKRHAIACEQLGARSEALLSWFRLYWRSDDLSPEFDPADNPELGAAWEAFLDLEPELPGHDFPAWTLIYNPGIARIAPSGEQESDCPESYRTLFALNHNASALSEAQRIALRTELKQWSPELFQHYLQNR
jgi:hypothetical protein